MQLEKTQTWLNCHYEFISAKNIIMLFVSSDDFTRLIWGRKIAKMDYNLNKNAWKKQKTM